MTNRIPNHVAFIMDGNSRWSKKNKLSKKLGYKKGIETLENLINICIDKKIKIITVYALSTENIYRKDIDIIYSIINNFINESKSLDRFKYIDFRLLGNRENINYKILSFFDRLEKNQSSNKKIILNLAYNYGSWTELENCIKKISQLYKDRKFIINEKIIRENLYTKNIPDPDILIRTGGKKRLSNFLLLQLKYTELFFIDTLWPDFNEMSFLKILKEYQEINRTFGL